MITDTQVLFRGVDHSDAVEEAVQKRAEKLERYSDQIQSLRVTVESPHNNHHKGKVYRVGVEAFIPNHDIVVNHDQHDKHAHEDIYVAIRDTFDAVERQIKEINEKKRRLSRVSKKAVDASPDIVSVEGFVEDSDEQFDEQQAANE
jgi:ribosomal subunit interface protein